MTPRIVPLLALLFLAPVASAQEADLPAADTLLERYVEAIGGRELLASLKTCVGEASLGQDLRLRYYYRGPNDMRREFVAGGRIVGTDVYLHDKDLAWAWQEGEGTVRVEGRVKAQYRQEALFPKASRLSERYVSWETLGRETIEGAEYYQVLMRVGGGVDELWLLNAETGLRDMMRMPIVDESGNAGIRTTVFSDWREVDGYHMPFRQTEFFKDQQLTLVWTSVEINREIPESFFAIPEEIQRTLPAPEDGEPESP